MKDPDKEKTEEALHQRLKYHIYEIIPIFVIGCIIMLITGLFINKDISFIVAVAYFTWYGGEIATHMTAIVSLMTTGKEIDLSKEKFHLFGEEISRSRGIILAIVVSGTFVFALRALSDWVGK